MDCILPGSCVLGIFQARILEWVAISFSRESSWPRDQTQVSWISCFGRWIHYHWATWEASVSFCTGDRLAEIEFPSQLKILKKKKKINCVTSYRDPGINKAFDLEQKTGNSKERKNLFLEVSAFSFLAPMLEGGITVCMMVQREIGSTVYLQFWACQGC